MIRVLCCAISVGAALLLSATSANGQGPGATPATVKPAVPPKPARLPDGHPNWTGFWIPPGGMMEVYRGPSGVDFGDAPRGGGAPNTAQAQAPRGLPALKSPYKERYEKMLADAQKSPPPDRTALCYPQGMPRQMGMIYGMEFLQTPNEILITGEWNAVTRRIWLDLKEHPPEDELDETYSGHSIGHWEGDTLVVDTVGIREDIPLDRIGLPHSKKLRIAERFTQTAPGILTIEQSITDPDLFDGEWKSTRTFKHRPDLRLREYVCLENNRNVDPVTGLASWK
jgi:hypothetical protein